MKRICKLTMLAVMTALVAALATACGQSTGATSDSSAAADAQPTKEELIAEVQQRASFDGHTSLTMDLDMQTASTEKEDAASVDTMTSTAKIDMSDNLFRMYMNATMLGSDTEIYVNGDDAVVVSNGVAVGGTVEELEMESFASTEAIMESAGADLANLADKVETIEKTTEGDETIYSVTLDPAKLADTAGSLGSFGQSGVSQTVTAMNVVYHVNADGVLSEMETTMDIGPVRMIGKIDLYDYDTTVVPDMPEPDMRYSDMNQ